MCGVFQEKRIIKILMRKQKGCRKAFVNPGIRVNPAPNRCDKNRANPCAAHELPAIKEAFEHFKEAMSGSNSLANIGLLKNPVV